MGETAEGLLNEALNLCVRGRKLDEALKQQTSREVFPESAAEYPDAFPLSFTPHLWLRDQYDSDLLDWEKRAREFLQNGGSAGAGQ